MRKKGFWFYFLLGLLILALVGCLLVWTNETQIIIDRGVQGFRALQWLSGGIAALVFVCWLGVWALRSLRHQKAMRRDAQKSRRVQADRAVLSYRDGRLDEASMREMIVGCFRVYNAGSSGAAAGNAEAAQFREYLSQMDTMNAYQARLHTLLELNGASDLNQTEGMLDALEQNLFMNLRQAINWTNTVNPKERMPEEISRKLKQIETKNGELLGTAKELLTQLTDYINHQGDSGSAAETAGAFIEQLRMMIQIKEEE